MSKTYSARAQDIHRHWHLVDADGKTLGRLASEVAKRLRGKHKPEYTPHVDTGDYVVIINAEKINVTGNKMTDKMYHRHTGYIGNLKSVPLDKLLATGREMLTKLKIYAGGDHPHAGQQPQVLDI
jgi:large subunit ribosomal protein L13